MSGTYDSYFNLDRLYMYPPAMISCHNDKRLHPPVLLISLP